MSESRLVYTTITPVKASPATLAAIAKIAAASKDNTEEDN